MNFFNGFSWAVPNAFSDAVSLYRFEEGDILYDTKKAYGENWERARELIGKSLQVTYPLRSGKNVGKNAGGVFATNWNSDARVDLYESMKKVSVGQIRTTQGRLYTALWHGDLSILEKNTPNPQRPITVRKVTKRLTEVSAAAKTISKGFPLFVMARDFSNPVSRTKFLDINSILRNHLRGDVIFRTPQRAGLEYFSDIAPTIEIAFFVTNDLDRNRLHDLIKSVVYNPAKNVKRDMFRLSAHGHIF